MSLDQINNFFRDFKKSDLYPDLSIIQGSGTNRRVKINNREYLMFCSNNYLGLANSQEIISQTTSVLKEHGLGPGGSRFLCGNIELINQAEHQLADFIGVEDVITFPTGYMANMAAFSALMDPFIGDRPVKKGEGIIFSDEFNHATIVDGCRFSSAKKIIYRHDNPTDLINKLKATEISAHKLIVTESIYSTEGTISKAEIVAEIAKEYQSMYMIDDAHGFGVIGENGSGALSHYKFDNQPTLIMTSLDKAVGAIGGILGGSRMLMEYLRIAARPNIFSSSLPAVVAAHAITVINILKKDNKILKTLSKNTRLIRRGLIEAGFKVMGHEGVPAIPVLIGEEKKGIAFEKKLFEKGIFVPCFRWPAVPLNTSRIRIAAMASHTNDDIEALINAFVEVGRDLSLVEK